MDVPLAPNQNAHTRDSIESEKHPTVILVEDAEKSTGYIDPQLERKVVRKMDLVIIPCLFMLFYLGYMDRTTIGNARLMGLQKALNLTNYQYFQCLMIFFVGYTFVELPVALLIRTFPAQYVFGVCLILFGLCEMLVPVAGGYSGLMALRTFLGAGEAVLTMGFLYLSQWYRPHELALRCGLIYWAAPIASFSGGLIAYGVAKHLNLVHGLASWKWLFLIEGVPSVFFGILVILILPSLPARVARRGHFLFPTEEEKQMLIARTTAAQNVPDAGFKSGQMWIAVKDPKTWLMAFTLGGPCIGITAFGLLLPTFIKEFGFDDLTANLYTIIPYSFALVLMPISCWYADRRQQRAVPHLICLAVSIVGFVILLSTTNKVALMSGCCFVAAGAYPDLPIAVSWLNITHGGWTKRCTAWALSQLVIEGYSIMVTEIYNGPPRFFLGHGVLLACYVLAFACGVVLFFWLRRENNRKDAEAEKRRTGELPPLGDIGTFEHLCDFHPDYRYVV